MQKKDDDVMRIPPNSYIHVIDDNTNISRMVSGPLTFVKSTNERITQQISSMICLKPKHYVKIENPVKRNEKGELVMTSFGEVTIRHGEYEYRISDDYEDPFPLYPGEIQVGKQSKLQVINKNQVLLVEAYRNIKKIDKIAGEQWQLYGPTTYIPQAGVITQGLVNLFSIQQGQALLVQAKLPGKCAKGIERHLQQKWIVRDQGQYIPSVNELVIRKIDAYILTEQKAIHLKAEQNFIDVYGKQRKAGEQWLVTNKMTDSHIQDVHEEIVNDNVKNIVLFSNQYAVIINPVDQNGRNQWGKKKLVIGECQFFIQPYEEFEGEKINDIIVLNEDQALLLQANQDFTDDEGNDRKSGQKWMIQGPRQYINPIEVEILEQRKNIPLDENEGIYIRNNNTGEVYVKQGETYMLKAHEELFEKKLDELTERLIYNANQGLPYTPGSNNPKEQKTIIKRDKTKLISFKAINNSAVQLYDFKTKKSRIVFGPDLVQLGPDEHFSLLKLSGGKPKRENVIQTISLQLGPDFMSDKLIVETADHARVTLELTYSWQFKLPDTQEDCLKLFSVKDFVGDACKQIASRIRGNISSVCFEQFHYNSSQKIKESVFGVDKTTGKQKTELVFKSNNLVITSVDIKNIEITDPKTREYLAKSVNLAIEIQSKSQEASSRHQAEKLDQEAKGQLERMKIEDLAKVEESQIKLFELQSESHFVQISGESIAKAKAETQAYEIHAKSEVKKAELKAQAEMIQLKSELDSIKQQQNVEYEYLKRRNELEIQQKKEMAEIETKKFTQTMDSIGRETLIAISKAGPEMKAKLLNGLGLKGFLITDGKNPINLFNTANGLVGDINKK